MNICCIAFHVYINEIHGSRSKIPSKNLARQRCEEVFNSSVKGLMFKQLRKYGRQALKLFSFLRNFMCRRLSYECVFKFTIYFVAVDII
jgi:hypothetical protein